MASIEPHLDHRVKTARDPDWIIERKRPTGQMNRPPRRL